MNSVSYSFPHPGGDDGDGLKAVTSLPSLLYKSIRCQIEGIKTI